MHILAGQKKKKSCMQLFKKDKLFLICGRVEEDLCSLIVMHF